MTMASSNAERYFNAKSAKILSTIVVTGTVAFLGWLAAEALISRDFRSQGGRVTQEQLHQAEQRMFDATQIMVEKSQKAMTEVFSEKMAMQAKQSGRIEASLGRISGTLTGVSKDVAGLRARQDYIFQDLKNKDKN